LRHHETSQLQLQPLKTIWLNRAYQVVERKKNHNDNSSTSTKVLWKSIQCMDIYDSYRLHMTHLFEIIDHSIKTSYIKVTFQTYDNNKPCYLSISFTPGPASFYLKVFFIYNFCGILSYFCPIWTFIFIR